MMTICEGKIFSYRLWEHLKFSRHFIILAHHPNASDDFPSIVLTTELASTIVLRVLYWPGRRKCAPSGTGSQHYTGWSQAGSPPPQCPSDAAWGSRLAQHRPSPLHLIGDSTPPPYAELGETSREKWNNARTGGEDFPMTVRRLLVCLCSKKVHQIIDQLPTILIN